MKHFFTKQLLRWHRTVEQHMPWKGEKNPYLIWLSEVILQQTRVEQGIPYFLKFKERYPNVIDLANASEEEVLKLWQGLGYYSRARNLHAAAKTVMTKHGGKFPTRYEDILSLKGVGPYTAAAIASFAYEQAYPVIDGNVYRVLSRFFGIKTAIDLPEAKKQFFLLANELMALAHKPSAFNQAIMDFGRLLCKPVRPQCTGCLMSKKCVAFINGIVNELPLKAKKINLKERFFHYLVIKKNTTFFLKKRTSNDIWKGLYEFPLIETSKLLSFTELKQHPDYLIYLPEGTYAVNPTGISASQKLTHQKINAIFFEVSILQSDYLHGYDNNQHNMLIPVEEENLHNFAFPKIIDWYFQQKELYLACN
jgi:A/G-specific adenine glycosylase